MFISIAGLIGAGKSTITKELSEKLQCKAYYELDDDNPYLELFYKDPYKYATIMQFKLLSNRYNQQQLILHYSDYANAIQDRTIYEDIAFANVLKQYGMINKLDYKTYIELFNILTNHNNLRHPDIILYIKVTPETSLKRIQNRNRNMENKINIEYLRDLDNEYSLLMEKLSIHKNIKILYIDGEKDIDSIVKEIINLL